MTSRRLVDIGVAIGLVILTSPLLLLGMALVLLVSGRPVFYAQDRVGQHGKLFGCLKLRTMRVGADAELESNVALKRKFVTDGFKLRGAAEVRVTSIGRVLRVTYLDELPQLFNVLRGDMTMVGPRPVVVAEIRQFEPHVAQLLAAKPGLFGAWAALGLRRPNYPARAQVELESLSRRSVASDILTALRCCISLLAGHPDECFGRKAEQRSGLSEPQLVEQDA